MRKARPYILPAGAAGSSFSAIAFAKGAAHGLRFGSPRGPAYMSLHGLQRLSSGGFAALRRGLKQCGHWVRARPRLAAWLYPDGEDNTSDAAYRRFNLAVFGRLGEQERMLADRPRMDFYHRAIDRHVHPGDRVIDLGTGTGILAAFAARRGAATVYAIDHSTILKHARRLAAHNGIKTIEFFATHSRDFTLAEPVDVILHEQMGDFLFDESMVPNVLDLRDRLLKPGGRIVPSLFEFFCEPIKVRDDRHIPFIWELNVHGYDYGCLERSRPQDPDYYRHNSSDLAVVEHCLGEPEPALRIDLQTLREADLPARLVITRTVKNAGRLDGFAVWFRALADDGPALSSGPLDAGRAPHWGFRILRSEAASFAVGEVIELTLTVGSWADADTWRWSHRRMG